jgi:hypothetical protein
MRRLHAACTSGTEQPRSCQPTLSFDAAPGTCPLTLEGACALSLASGVVLHAARLRSQALPLELALRLLRPLLRRVGAVVNRGYAQRPVPARRGHRAHKIVGPGMFSKLYRCGYI